MAERIIKQFDKHETSTMSDRLWMLAVEIEESLIQCGATPGKDYKYKDVFDWAVSIFAATAKPFENPKTKRQ